MSSLNGKVFFIFSKALPSGQPRTKWPAQNDHMTLSSQKNTARTFGGSLHQYLQETLKRKHITIIG